MAGEEKVTLEFLVCQSERVINDIGNLRDDMQVLTAMVMRHEGTMTAILTELRAMHSQIGCMNNRVSKLEDKVFG